MGFCGQRTQEKRTIFLAGKRFPEQTEVPATPTDTQHPKGQTILIGGGQREGAEPPPDPTPNGDGGFGGEDSQARSVGAFAFRAAYHPECGTRQGSVPIHSSSPVRFLPNL